MPKLTSGIYFEVTEIDWEDPRQVEGAKRVIAEMRHFIRNMKGRRHPFSGPMAIPGTGRAARRFPANPEKFNQVVEALDQAKGDLRLASLILRKDYSSVYNRMLTYKKKGLVRQLPDKTWQTMKNGAVKELRALTA